MKDDSGEFIGFCFPQHKTVERQDPSSVGGPDCAGDVVDLFPRNGCEAPGIELYLRVIEALSVTPAGLCTEDLSAAVNVEAGTLSKVLSELVRARCAAFDGRRYGMGVSSFLLARDILSSTRSRF